MQRSALANILLRRSALAQRTSNLKGVYKSGTCESLKFVGAGDGSAGGGARRKRSKGAGIARGVARGALALDFFALALAFFALFVTCLSEQDPRGGEHEQPLEDSRPRDGESAPPRVRASGVVAVFVAAVVALSCAALAVDIETDRPSERVANPADEKHTGKGRLHRRDHQRQDRARVDVREPRKRAAEDVVVVAVVADATSVSASASAAPSSLSSSSSLEPRLQLPLLLLPLTLLVLGFQVGTRL